MATAGSTLRPAALRTRAIQRPNRRMMEVFTVVSFVLCAGVVPGSAINDAGPSPGGLSAGNPIHLMNPVSSYVRTIGTVTDTWVPC